MFRWILRLLLTFLATRILVIATRQARSGGVKPAGTQSFHPGGGPQREKTPQPEALSPHPIEDADYEELPRSSV